MADSVITICMCLLTGHSVQEEQQAVE